MRRITALAATGLVWIAVAVSPAAASGAGPTSTLPSSLSSTTGPEIVTSSTVVSPTSSTTPAPPSTPPAATAPTTTGAAAHRGVASGRADAAAVVTITTTSTGPCALFCYSPARLTVPAGATVTFTNQTDVDHSVKRCDPASCDGASGGTGVDPTFSADFAVPPHRSFHFTFGQPGTYVYYCSIHGYSVMHGTITVTAAMPTTTLAPAPTEAQSTAPGGSALAHTGGSSSGALTVAVIFLVAGLAAASLRFGRRRAAG